MYVVSRRGLPTLLYHPFGFAPTAKVEELIRRDVPCVAVTPDELPEYAGDRIFVMAYDDAESQASLAKLLKHPVWNGLEAVKNGSMYVVDWKWNYDDPLTHAELIEQLPDVLRYPI